MRATRRPVLPRPIRPMVLPLASQPLKVSRATRFVAAERAVRLEHLLGQGQHHADRMLGDRFGIRSGLVDHQHARRGTGRHVDRVVARARGRDHQQVGAALQEGRVRLVLVGHLVAGAGDAVDMARLDDRPCLGVRRLEVEPVHRDFGFLVQHVGDIRRLAVVEPEDLLGVRGWSVSGHGPCLLVSFLSLKAYGGRRLP